jgi:hypothetical protein
MESDPNQQAYSWAIYRIRASAARFIGIVEGQSNEAAAIRQAVEDFKIPPDLADRLLAQRQE